MVRSANESLAATSVKLPADLKRRLERLATRERMSTHALMVDVLSREAERLELRARFAADAAASEEQVLASGKAIALEAAFDYLESRVRGERRRRPAARPWRASR